MKLDPYAARFLMVSLYIGSLDLGDHYFNVINIITILLCPCTCPSR